MRLFVRDVGEITELPPIEVVRGVTITGRLINSQDRPIADARVLEGYCCSTT